MTSSGCWWTIARRQHQDRRHPQPEAPRIGVATIGATPWHWAGFRMKRSYRMCWAKPSVADRSTASWLSFLATYFVLIGYVLKQSIRPATIITTNNFWPSWMSMVGPSRVSLAATSWPGSPIGSSSTIRRTPAAAAAAFSSPPPLLQVSWKKFYFSIIFIFKWHWQMNRHFY